MKNDTFIVITIGYSLLIIVVAFVFYYEGQYRARKEMIRVLIEISRSKDMDSLINASLTMLKVIMKQK